MCERAVVENRPLLELSPLRPKATEPVAEQGTAPVSSSTRTVARASSPYQARKGVDDDTKRSGCRRYRCCQGQGGCMHSDRNGAEDLPHDRVGATQFDCMASQASGRQGGDGGKRRLRACLGQGVAQTALEVRIVDPKRVRSFAESAGRLAKNDKIDAEMIAWFAETFSEAPSQVEDPAHEEIKALVKGRKSLIDLRARLEMQKEHEVPALVGKAHARLLKKLASEIAAIETAIGAKIKATPAFAVRAEIIQSVPGFAEATALTLLAGLPELGQVSNEVAAALVGVAPYDDDSGKRHGQRCIKGGRRWVRNALYMPCVGAATLNNLVFKAFYQRLIAKGKKPKAALIACVRKLIVILNTMIARGEKWDPKRYQVA